MLSARCILAAGQLLAVSAARSEANIRPLDCLET